jgi:hypothetical protein
MKDPGARFQPGGSAVVVLVNKGDTWLSIETLPCYESAGRQCPACCMRQGGEAKSRKNRTL